MSPKFIWLMMVDILGNFLSTMGYQFNVTYGTFFITKATLTAEGLLEKQLKSQILAETKLLPPVLKYENYFDVAVQCGWE